MALPPGADDRLTFEGVETTRRTIRMVREARYLFKLRGGGDHPGISQGGWRPTTRYSRSTHARDALDFKTRVMSRDRTLLWEWCVWEVGFASWRRAAIIDLWPVHTHSLPKDGWLSDAAEKQIDQWYQGDNALTSDRDYPRILSSGFVARTWEKYETIRPSGTVDLSGLVAAFTAGKPAEPADDAGDNDVQQVQRALNHYLDSKLAVDGVPGPATRGVYATYQTRLYGIAAGDGIPGEGSLEKLGLKVID